METRKAPAREWNIKFLRVLGQKEGVKAKYLRAVPVLILEKWVKDGRVQDTANCVYSDDIADRLESAGLASFKDKGRGIVLGVLVRIQNARKLTNPTLIEYQKVGKFFWIRLPHYEKMLEEYRQEYSDSDLFKEDYKKLFPNGEPKWESLPTVQPELKEAEPMPAALEVRNEIQGLFAPIERVLRDRQQTVEKLTREKQKLQAELVALQATLQEDAVPYRRIVDEELRNDCAKLLENRETYIDAIRRAGVVVEERLMKTTGGNGPEKLKEGVELVDYALLPNVGKLIISDHPAEQDGVRMLFRGAVQFVRNPPAHKKVQYTELEAWQTISLIDYLLLLLRQAKPRNA